MLVLSRHKNEEIVIGAGTEYETRVKVVDIRGDKVRLGFVASKNIAVHRSEIQEAIDRKVREECKSI